MSLRNPPNVQTQNMMQTLFTLRGANLASTADQVFTRQANFTNYLATSVVAVTKSGAFGITCLGGIYTAASKGGDAILSALQSWANLTAIGICLPITGANILNKAETAVPILSLTTGNTGTLTADIFIQGIIVD